MQARVNDGNQRHKCASNSGLFNRNDLVRWDVRKLLNLAARPSYPDVLHRFVRSKAEVYTRIAGAGVANSSACFVPLRASVGCPDANLRTNAHAVAMRSNEADEKPVLTCGANIAEELDGLVEAGDECIDAASVEDVAESCAAMRSGGLETRAGAGADVLEFPVSKIAKDGVGLWVGLRWDSLLDVVHHVGACDKKVLPAVEDKVEDSATPN